MVHTLRNTAARRVAFALSASAAAIVAASPAHAQVDEIVVTAQKVEQNIQDVPIAISAVTGDALERAGAKSLEDLTSIVPSVTFRKGTTNANSAIVMRGVGTISFSIAAEPSVSTVVDGIVLSRSGQSFLDLVDFDRIEVLRGPQGTLFGKNASAGLVNIVSKGGTDTFQAEALVSGTTDDEYRGRLTVSGPIAENLTGRLTGFYGNFDGNIKNTFYDKTVNGYEHYGARGLLDWEGDGAKVRVIADYFRADDDCCAEVTGVSRGTVLDRELGIVPEGEDTRRVNQNLITRSLDRQWSVTLNADIDTFADHTFSVITGYRNWKNTEIRDGDFLPRPLVPFVENGVLVSAPQLHDRGTVETDQVSAEVRLASPQNQALTYQVGGFIWYSKNRQDFNRSDVTCATSTSPIDTVTGAQPCNLADTVNTLFPSATSESNVSFRNYAVFGQATYEFTPELRFTLGGRYTHDEVSFTHLRGPSRNLTNGVITPGAGLSTVGAGGTIATGGNGTNLSRGETDADNFSGKAVLQYDLAERAMVYASYTRGYKGPAFNVFFNHVAPTNSTPIDPEKSNSYEVGLKSQLFDRMLQLNATAFLVDYKGFQANNFVLLNGAVVTNLTNAGSVRSKGFEVDATLAPLEGLSLRANFAYADAKVRKFNPNPLTNAPDARDGTRLPLAPKFSYTVGADYDVDAGPVKLYLSSDWHHVSRQFSDLGESGPIDPYGIWNASVGVSDPEDKYRLTVLVRNILDDSYVLLNTTAGQRLMIPRDADRYAGVNLRVRFD
ncbi:iron complex outermembrane receptor protein [Novosphingobium chloroacetimidivorans]|uniref:Iron complex outermembrane receptor protein n=1 Tax=Novosphingobium chloroacetimidivorans TaxID=1428314 RepID=A0A7W7KA18_9SPHN|nr:TonB-dependent receptor [Novosphingobium chloroacetimidivorans]MBB4858288.1 iron complex outermembrane receptor protein [Novosphingobium chloroacetimidivorans]